VLEVFMTIKIPTQPENSFRVKLEISSPEPRLDVVLFKALQVQNENEELKNISKAHLKRLFLEKKIFIKGQNAKATSAIHSGLTYIDILL
jgi:hypothetical protein